MGQRALVVRKRKKKQQTNQNMSNINKHNSCKKKMGGFCNFVQLGVGIVKYD